MGLEFIYDGILKQSIEHVRYIQEIKGKKKEIQRKKVKKPTKE